jgi:hypothetical protein
MPRFFELIELGDAGEWFSHIDNLTISGLKDYKWRDCDLRDRRAIRAYLFALWKYNLFVYPSPSIIISDLAIDLARAEDDITPSQKVFDAELGNLSALRHLVEFIVSGGNRKWKHWLTRPFILQTLENAYYAHMDKPIADEFLEGVKSYHFWKDFYGRSRS